jgi:hypothetical protein
MPLYENYCHAISLCLHFRRLSPAIVAGGSGARVNGSQARRRIASRLALVAAGALVRAQAKLKPPHEPGSVPAVPYRVPSRVWWPSGSGTAQLSQTVPVRRGGITGELTRVLAGPQRAGGLPVTVTALAGGRAGNVGQVPAAVRVAVAPRRVARADGVSGLVMQVPGWRSPGSGAS